MKLPSLVLERDAKIYTICVIIHNMDVIRNFVPTRIGVESGHSLLVDGLISRLREYIGQMEIEIFDFSKPDYLSDIVIFQPTAIILEENKRQQDENYSLKQILNALPNVTLVYLMLGTSEVQVIQSEQYIASGVRELIERICPPGINLINSI